MLEITQAEAALARQRALTRAHAFEPLHSVVGELARFATATPAKPAVVDGEHVVTYRALAGRVRQLRELLLAAGIGEGHVVALLGRRSADTIALFLALEDIGAIYLPLDPAWPVARTEVIVRQAGVTLLVHQEGEPPAGVPSLRLPRWQADSPVVPHRAPAGAEPRYVIFTSGTTGMPKGAVVEQRGMLNHLRAKVLDLGLTAADVVAFTAPLVFDISIWQMTIGVLTGATTVVFDEQQVSFPRRLLTTLRENEITVVELVPTVVGWMTAQARRSGERLPALRWCISTGEELHPPVAEAVMDELPHVALMNAYGPTECSDDVTHHVVRRADLTATRLPVGAPIANAVLYLLVQHDGGWRAAAEGEPGELFVGGICVGRGYLGEPELTAAAFLSDVLDPGSATGRLYRTGDLAVFRDGLVHYLGRGDRQVKVAGVRMELDEIEAALKRHHLVAHCAVVTEPTQDGPVLVAHYVTDGGSPAPGDLKEFLGGLLPAAMVPKRWQHVQELPMTRNGKIDHKALATSG
ncbi:amino acid adenylation domain-containing protein [Lentzea aerocolonigenes]|uniref:amino acid adenylation domain-containing protein n=1 Tax=Lentzea aerocolonigenes TaxID=68170 RepID=UPI0005EC9269|nr:amino acid adenylation domain-containing protein [Lentzea aerocolonigenes]